MVFSYRARRKRDGQVECGTLEAGSRAEAIALLGGRGLTPLSVAEGGSAGKAPAANARQRALLWAIAALVAVLAGVCIWSFTGAAADADVDAPGKARLAAAKARPATGASAAKPAEEKAVEKKPVTAPAPHTPIAKRPAPAAKRPASARGDAPRQAAADAEEKAGKNLPKPLEKRHEQRRIFSSTSETLLSGIANTKRGYPPPPRLAFPFGEDLHEILGRAIDILPDDDEHTIEVKRNTIKIKEELKKYLADGGEPETFMAAYHEDLSRDFNDWKASQQYVIKLLQAGERDEAVRFADEINGELSRRGVRGVVLPENLMNK